MTNTTKTIRIANLTTLVMFVSSKQVMKDTKKGVMISLPHNVETKDGQQYTTWYNCFVNNANHIAMIKGSVDSKQPLVFEGIVSANPWKDAQGELQASLNFNITNVRALEKGKHVAQGTTLFTFINSGEKGDNVAELPSGKLGFSTATTTIYGDDKKSTTWYGVYVSNDTAKTIIKGSTDSRSLVKMFGAVSAAKPYEKDGIVKCGLTFNAFTAEVVSGHKPSGSNDASEVADAISAEEYIPVAEANADDIPF
jgi:hypothetical protein